MFRKFAIAAVTVAAVATASVTFTPSQAYAGDRGAAVAAGIIGFAAGAIAGSAVASHNKSVRYNNRVRYQRCRTETVREWSAYHGRYIVVGHRRVCW